MQPTLIELIVAFFLFIFMQAAYINGFFEACRGGCVNEMNKGRICTGMVIYKLAPEWFDRNKHREWSKPIFSCVKCMSSFHGGITFWPAAIYFFGFHWVQVPVYVFDVFILVTVNWFIYKKL